MKVKDIVEAYNVINSAKLTKMQDADKFTLIKAMKALKPVKTAYEDFIADAREKLKGEAHEDMLRRAEEWKTKLEGDKKKSSDFTPEELAGLNEVNAYFNNYAKKVDECVKEEADKDVRPEYSRLSEEAFGKLLASNEDWNVEKAVLLSDLVC